MPKISYQRGYKARINFIECKLNEPLLKYLKEMLQDMYQAKLLTFSIQHLLKIDCENNCTLFLNIGVWTIYKLIVNRNITGIDKRKVASKQIFQRESSNINMTRKRMFLPKEFLSVIKKYIYIYIFV